jgi:hypothetical protein
METLTNETIYFFCFALIFTTSVLLLLRVFDLAIRFLLYRKNAKKTTKQVDSGWIEVIHSDIKNLEQQISEQEKND